MGDLTSFLESAVREFNVICYAARHPDDAADHGHIDKAVRLNAGTQILPRMTKQRRGGHGPRDDATRRRLRPQVHVRRGALRPGALLLRRGLPHAKPGLRIDLSQRSW